MKNLWLETWWRAGSADDLRPVTVARPDDGRSVRLGAVLGYDADLFTRWSAAESIFAAPAQTSSETSAPWKEDRRVAAATLSAAPPIHLPPAAAVTLDLSPGDPLMIDGHPFTYAGVTDPAALDRLRNPDGQSWLPPDATAEAALRAAGGSSSSANLDNPDAAGDLLRLRAAQVALAPNLAVARLGGRPHAALLLPDAAASQEGAVLDPVAVGRELAAFLPVPVWTTGPEGAARLTLGQTTRVSGVLQLLPPILLGGLIIFGTLLGSISDRQKEIYTFSALGLGPRHVGLLFFAEAAVYAAVGGLGGQLLAQVVALAASWASDLGWIPPVSINFASTQALFAIAVVMATVLISAIYPALRAARSANPGLARAWTLPAPEPPPHDDQLHLTFPFTVSAYDLTGVVAYLAEHFRQHADAGLGPFAASDVTLTRSDTDQPRLAAELALAPFDLGVTQTLTLSGQPSDIPGVDEVRVHLHRHSGTKGDWTRANRTFIKHLRQRFLLWRTLPPHTVQAYRQQTLEQLGIHHDGLAEPAENETAYGRG